MPINSVFRVRQRGQLRGQNVEFGVHLRQIDAAGSPDHIATTWQANILPLVAACTSTEVSWNEIVVQDTAKTGLHTLTLVLAPPTPGTEVGECLPGQNSMLISFLGATKGKRAQGRIFVPGISETSTSGGLVTGTQMTALQALAAGLLQYYGPGGSVSFYQLVVYSPPTPPFRPKPAPPIHTDTLITPVTTASAKTLVHTQRRRVVGVGR